MTADRIWSFATEIIMSMSAHPDDTICALSTAPGRSGIAVVRISGAGSLDLAKKVFRPLRAGAGLSPRTAVSGRVIDGPEGRELDQGIVVYFPAPRSYTGEDVVEISLHGSPVLVSRLLEQLCSHGARLAEPGEFTMRAFLAGKLDLVQAEAVRDVIEARTLYQVQLAQRQRSGEVSRRLAPMQEVLVEAIVALESAVEFVEEDLPLESREGLAGRLGAMEEELAGWLDGFRRGRLVRDGFSMAVVGSPNVGKSSLFNALLHQERSIVTETPGTTRDLVSEHTSLEGIPVRLVDTAGVRESTDSAERMGVNRSWQAIADADALLWVLDGSRPPSAEDRQLRERLAELPCIVVINKADLPKTWSEARASEFAAGRARVTVSARSGAGLDALRAEIMRHLLGDDRVERDGVLLTNVRHFLAVEEACRDLRRAIEALTGGVSEEYVLVDLQLALRYLGSITGETTTEDLLDRIFSKFCIGK
ncbi:MAG: tRNA uridine-5-carboxymethylaminomethyl(34) synthesis GTPase MnmE [Acidobacteria bacterium]|nr:tRNA uridine-5-carboxymethylaminomethyl(34) synthesis GTPase MnmE [Acidobacteriota bacterium]